MSTLLELAQEMGSYETWPQDSKTRKDIIYGIWLSSMRTRGSDSKAIESIYTNLVIECRDDSRRDRVVALGLLR